MTRRFALAAALGSFLVGIVPAAAQDQTAGTSTQPPDDARPITLQHFRPNDQRGVNMFETPKDPGVEYQGFRLEIGAAFTSQLQSLDHENAAQPRIVSGVDQNQLADIGTGFNNSTANLYLNAQLADGIRVQLTSYLSSRHHNETWVKDGYLLIDKVPLDIAPLNLLMAFTTIRAGHFEINYGDAHFRRSDNGQAMFNPFVGNYILDAFTTEIGAEVYVRPGPFMVMGSITGGEVRGTVLTPEKRSMALIGKAGYDNQLNENLRVRLTGSFYSTGKALNNTLYGGDRAGSRYYYVLENVAATESAQFTSGLLNPGFRSEVSAMQLNPFVKFQGLELFGVLERAEGKSATEAAKRDVTQYAFDAVYRFLPREQAFAGIRYNTVNAELAGIANEVNINRWQLGGGWFVTRNILIKAEYVNQEYKDFPVTDIRHNGKFNGGMLEGVISF